MCIQHDIDTIGLSLSHYLFEDWQVCVVVLMSFGLKPLPSHVESDGVEAPFFEVGKVFSHKRAIPIEAISGGVVWKLLKDWVDPMKYSDPIMLIHEKIAILVHTKLASP